jgi:hypothetical protein
MIIFNTVIAGRWNRLQLKVEGGLASLMCPEARPTRIRIDELIPVIDH